MTTEERLEKLERELARANRPNRWLLAVVGLAVVGLALAWTLTIPTAVARAEGAGVTPKVIRASEFILEDDKGKARARLGVDTGGSSLELSDENGKTGVVLGVARDQPGLYLLDKKDNFRVGLTVFEDQPALRLSDETGKTRAALRVDKDGTSLILSDEKGKTRAALGAHGTVMLDGTQTKYAESSLRLYGPDGKRLWSAP